MVATSGVLPRPPIARLPTLMTGWRRRCRRSGRDGVALAGAAARSPAYRRAQRPGRTGPVEPGERNPRSKTCGTSGSPHLGARNGRTVPEPAGGRSWAIAASVRGLAPRLASTSARAAAPRRARSTGSREQATSTVASSAADVHLDGAAVARGTCAAISAKFCMCGPNTIGLPCTAGSRMLCPPCVDQAAADEHDRRDLKQLRQLADRVEDHDVGPRLGVDRQLGAADDAQPFGARERSASAKRSGLRGAMMSSALRHACARTRANAASTGSSSPLSVLAAMNTGRDGRHPEEAQHAAARRGPAAAPGVSSDSNFRLPVTVTRVADRRRYR